MMGDWLEQSITELRQWVDDEVDTPAEYATMSSAWLLGVGRARAQLLLDLLEHRDEGR